MERMNLRIMVVFAIVALIAIGFQFVNNENRAAIGADGDSPVSNREVPKGQFRGFAIQLHNRGDKDHPYEEFITEMADAGANTVFIVVHAYQENCASTSIFLESRKKPSDERLKKIIRHAHSKGLRVGLMPVVLLAAPRKSEWRGKIAPDNWSKWWENYTQVILHFAYICSETDVEMMMVGSELNSTEGQTKQWKRLIAKVRRHYGGLMGYSANWDHYRTPKFWDDLDLVGMTAYYDLTGGAKPTVGRLTAAWKPLKKEILAWQKTIGKPILFTELGWPNQVTCAQYPWNYYASEIPDPQAQANCFEAFFDTWISEQNVAGFMVWEWRKRRGAEESPEKDISYIPCGKQAMRVITKYFSLPEAVTTQPTSQPAGSVAKGK